MVKGETAAPSVWKWQRDSFLHERSSGGKPQTQPLKVLDGHWCCCIAEDSKPPMQYEKREERGLSRAAFQSACFCACIG